MPDNEMVGGGDAPAPATNGGQSMISGGAAVTGTAHGTDSPPVVLRVPADKTYVVLVRSAVSHLGARLGFTMAEITDLRLAVDEACGLLLPIGAMGGEDTLECRFAQGAGELRVTVSAAVPSDARPDTDGFGWNVLSALVDSLVWSVTSGLGQVELVKRSSTVAGA